MEPTDGSRMPQEESHQTPTVKELQHQLRAKGLPISGNKQELLKRLQLH